ncbi:endonuclease III [Campylobacter sp. faydin G-140]|uniref:endonuclease III domain-containing protein n=1 Tax=Campylobacter anatolicus TaxID=2829105 RepID=UPI001B915639|nr:endonuclease III [Campylobacter anatolicus]MBR8464781.1 endonuclease III [Campylobacter anatolicus]
MNSTEIFLTLLNSKNRDNLDELKWPNENTFEVVVGAILVQNTNWKNVEKALINLKNADKISLDKILSISVQSLAGLIKPSGFYNTKAKRLNTLCVAMQREFGDFESFRESVSREWLLGIKGIGAETCDTILAYACSRPAMIVDAYALRILSFLGYEFGSYDEAAEWLSSLEYDKIYQILGDNYNETEIFKLYHALILEFCKEHFKGKNLDDSGKMILSTIS